MAKLLGHRIWLVPLAFAAVLGAVGARSYLYLESTLREDLRSELETLLSADVTALRVWVESHQAAARVQAEDERNRALFRELAETASRHADPREALRNDPAAAELRRRLAQVAALHQYTGFGVVDRSGIALAGDDEVRAGTRSALAPEIAQRVLAGRAMVTKPGMWRDRGADVEPQDDQVMLVVAPIRDDEGRGIGILGFGISALLDFSRILKVARMGVSGETYAFNAQGTMLSESRFDEQLEELGLLDPGEHSAMRIQIRDPGGDMTRGHVPSLPLLARPLTRMAASAISGEDGHDVIGYPDYRGVPVIGAWTWLEDLQMGVATEIDVAEAYSVLVSLERQLVGVVGLLALAALGMFAYSAVLLRMGRRMDRIQQLGRYRIIEKVGEGGMGAVYRARHALLRRPTAIKLLRPSKSSPESIARFEREVQVASGLTHPNTIAIYDYGRTPEGLFYYAMEYLEGMTIARCVESDGPQPEARVVHVMKQVCGSLAEAHALGLIHRDLKPANVMLCERGGMFDFVKVLDFGLVRIEEQPKDLALTGTQSLTGTPLYLSPESIDAPESIDVRSDIYQLGAIAYYMLAGRHVFVGDGIVEVLSQHLGSSPEPIAALRGEPVSKELERVVLRCLAKSPEQRFANAGELLAAFEQCEASGAIPGHWGQDEAAAYWRDWRERHPRSDEPGESETSYPSGYDVDIAGRLGKTSSEG